MKDRAVVVIFKDATLIQELMDHFVKKSVTKISGSGVEVLPEVYGWGVSVKAPVPPGAGNANWNRFQLATEMTIIELIPPPA